MRRAIAIIFTITFISTFFFDLAGIIKTTELTKYFAYSVYGAIILFYFGSRTAEKMKIDEMIKEGDVSKIKIAIDDLSREESEKMEEQLGQM